ncbi:alpha/beta fold hydrolase [Halonatronum saccharophilum]|uniref:alpha/beta fold hydrolase n=1 Tax=Halonatronum saccharophilum TaxID=150060 RepID=UPI000487373B|nr:alpha/beta fold hydrolase [Halonatronum saccharophilum]
MSIYRPICARRLANILGGREDYFQTSTGRIYYNEAGEGEPLLLIHGINAGASNLEWANNFKTLSQHFKVYAIDLPGFARSDKEETIYRPEIHIQAITEFIRNKIKSPVKILSSGLSAAYSSFIAANNLGLIESLALVTPSGLTPDPICSTSFSVYNLFTNPIQGDGLYNTFTSRVSIRYFLEEFIYQKTELVTTRLVNYTFISAHQCPNAKYAPVSFVAGFSELDIRPFFSELEIPILVLWGREAKLNPVENLDQFRNLNPEIEYKIFENSGLIPQRERAVDFNRIIIDFFS